MTSPIVFISYAWESEALKAWVRSFAVRLREDGVDAKLDCWETAPGDHIASFMERGIRESDFVLIVCTPTYKARSEQGMGGVAYEGSIITAEIATGKSRRKFIPLLRGHEWPQSAPHWLLGSFFIDFRGEPYNENSYQELLDTVLRRREEAPPLGKADVQEAPRSQQIEDRPERSDLRRASSYSWPFVWKKLRDMAPFDSSLIEEGKRWIRENMDSGGWGFVWEDLVRSNPFDEELRSTAYEWLRSSIEHPSWAFVWRKMVEMEPFSEELRALGKEHLRRT